MEKSKKKAEKKELKDGETKKIIITDRKVFLANKKYLCDIGANFEYQSSGSIDRVIYGEREFISMDLKGNSGKGHHLSKSFKKDIDAYLEKNKGNLPRWDNNYREQMFNIDAIEKAVGKQLVMIDINDCYWRTAYMLGYISEETYIIGKRKKAWKLGRNACIGGLVKVKVVVPYINGKPDRERRKIIRTPIEYQYIRNHIIGHVHKLFEYLFAQMGDTFYMFLTDCLVTTYDKQRQVEEYLNGEGYRVKHKPIEFIEVDRKNKKVSWYDFDGKGKTQAEKLHEVGIKRFYNYSIGQVIQSQLIASSKF